MKFNDAEKAELLKELKEQMEIPVLAVKMMLTSISNDDDLFDTIAKASKKAYDAFVRAGFSEDQAAQLCQNILTRLGSSNK
jgi:predicted glycoside hydrolase/deacetylase ChbG (UPF0249 family)